MVRIGLAFGVPLARLGDTVSPACSLVSGRVSEGGLPSTRIVGISVAVIRSWDRRHGRLLVSPRPRSPGVFVAGFRLLAAGITHARGGAAASDSLVLIAHITKNKERLIMNVRMSLSNREQARGLVTSDLEAATIKQAVPSQMVARSKIAGCNKMVLAARVNDATMLIERK